MNIGIPKERRPFEYRTGVSPAGIRLLAEGGHKCFVERGTGIGAGFSDEDYLRAGARVVYTTEEVYGRAQVILKVSRPTTQELNWIVPGTILMGYIYLAAAHPSKVDTLLSKEITSIAYEQIQSPDGSHPVLKPLSQIGGRMAVHLAAGLLQNNHKSNGVLLGGVPGVPPAEVVIIGGGVAGEAAAKGFIGLGAHVTILDHDLHRLQELAEIFRDQIVTLISYPFHILRACSYADVVIGAVLLPGQKTPVVIPRAIFHKMRKGSVFIDMSIDQGGCAETSRPTSHDNPTYVEEGVIHCCIPNLPGVVARTATHAFLNAARPYIEAVMTKPIDEAIASDPALAKGVVTHKGKIHNLTTVSHGTE